MQREAREWQGRGTMRAESIIRDGKESFGGTGGEGEPERTGSSEAADVYDVVQRNLHASLWGPEGAAAAGCLCSCSKVGNKLSKQKEG